MKRIISTFCLLVGASVASYAGPITATTGTQLLGANAALQTFDSNSTFPLGAFTSLPQFNLANGTTSTNVTIGAAGAATGPNRGTQGSVTTNASAIAAFGGTTPGAVLAGQYLSSSNMGDNTLQTSFLRSLSFTFSSGVSEFLLDYFGSDTSLNYFIVNGITSTQYALANQNCSAAGCNGSGLQAGYKAGGADPIASINSVTFFIIGTDNEGVLGGDNVLFDNLRVVGGTATPPPSDGGGGGGVIPEPSTYALIGAGLLALAYKRRKR